MTVTLSSGDAAGVDLRLYGPGDVIGIDPRAHRPHRAARAFARDFPPDQFAAIEFDPPDFPWMFTPGPTGDQRPAAPVARARRRRASRPGVEHRGRAVTGRSRQLIDRGARRTRRRAARTCPSRGRGRTPTWSRTTAPPSVPEHLDAHPDLNVSRLLCPRRLESGERTTSLPRAGLRGRPARRSRASRCRKPPRRRRPGAARGGVGASVTLPLYFHWEFRTGPTGDFESLARQLDAAARARHRRHAGPMFIGAAHPALPRLAPDAGGIVELEGALRAPDRPAPAPTLGPEHAAVRRGSGRDPRRPRGDHVPRVPRADAEAVAPPVYGGRHVKVADARRLDPRAGSASSTPTRGTAPRPASARRSCGSTRSATCRPPGSRSGDVLAANALLDRARLMQRVAERVLNRHVRPLSPDVVLSLTASVHVRRGPAARTCSPATSPAARCPPGRWTPASGGWCPRARCR